MSVSILSGHWGRNLTESLRMPGMGGQRTVSFDPGWLEASMRLLQRKDRSAAALSGKLMTGYVALLRAVNVGGTGKLAMSTLTDLCETAGLAQVRTYIASGNVVFRSDRPEDQIRLDLEDRLRAYAGKNVGVVVRAASEIADVLTRSPFDDAPGNRVMALFVDGPLPADPFDGVTGVRDEQIRLGKRELFVLFPSGMAASRLRIPSAKIGTARNMNTVAKLAGMIPA